MLYIGLKNLMEEINEIKNELSSLKETHTKYKKIMMNYVIRRSVRKTRSLR